jgi:hypothetical protein
MPGTDYEPNLPHTALVPRCRAAAANVSDGVVTDVGEAGGSSSGQSGDQPAIREAEESRRALRERVRTAMSAGDFLDARRSWEQYSAEVRKAIEDGTATPAMLAEMGDLVEWSRIVVLSFRTHAADRLKQDHAARAYR